MAPDLKVYSRRGAKPCRQREVHKIYGSEVQGTGGVHGQGIEPGVGSWGGFWGRDIETDTRRMRSEGGRRSRHCCSLLCLKSTSNPSPSNPPGSPLPMERSADPSALPLDSPRPGTKPSSLKQAPQHVCPGHSPAPSLWTCACVPSTQNPGPPDATKLSVSSARGTLPMKRPGPPEPPSPGQALPALKAEALDICYFLPWVTKRAFFPECQPCAYQRRKDSEFPLGGCAWASL